MSLKAKASRGSDTDVLRDEFESSREWKLRKMFLDANVDSLPGDRLVCLSKCFINSAMYRCSYPRAVMKEIESRSSGLLESYQQETREDRKCAAKELYAASFVKASDSFTVEDHSESEACQLRSTESVDADGSHPSPVEIVNMENNREESTEFSDSVTGTSSSTDDSPCIALTSVHPATPILPLQDYKKLIPGEKHPLIKKLRQLACRTLESKDEFALNKVMSCITKGSGVKVEFKQDAQTAKRLGESYGMRVLFNDCLVATGAARSKPLARKIGMELALQKFHMPYLRVTETESGDREIEASVEPFTSINYRLRYKHIGPPSASALNKPVGLTLPGKVLISSKDFLPPSLTQFSHQASEILLPKESIEVTRLAQREAKLKSLDYPVTKSSSNISNVKQSEVAENGPNGTFILVQLSGIEEGPVSMLRRSADFSGMLLDIEHTLHSPASVSCEVRLGGQVIAEASDSNTKAAKFDAACKALEYLGQHCWVLRLKGADGTSTVSKNELFKKIQQRTDVIGDTNVGNKMLRKMGWTGGGVGKDGMGIVEPVSAEGVLGRAGLGLSSSSAPGADFEERQFRQKVRTALRKYIESEEQEDLRFATEFSKEERKVIHQEASKFHLRTVSRGKQDCRFLTVGRKRSSQQLLQHVSECGGETNSYVLLPPGSYQYQHQTAEQSQV
ncbi:NF-kappa-B-repressing factor [Elysia marginata]|uniref:NF-kappa-B-repressing factor n=1 Tax=Elysia marginata TaxID=1093978 RepID=A0AAV4IG70_9GAST|nr:NF-kappa-B-repressing factor [Elysia marginata]